MEVVGNVVPRAGPGAIDTDNRRATAVVMVLIMVYSHQARDLPIRSSVLANVKAAS
jgi:hypothetical protein